MGLQELDGSDERFLRYIEGLAGVIGHADRVGPLRDYCTEPDAAMRTQERGADGGGDERLGANGGPASVRSAAFCRSGGKKRSDDKVLGKGARDEVLPQVERHSPIEAWIIDDTGFPRRRASTLLAWRGSTADNWASRTILSGRAVSLSLANRDARACRCAIGCICRKTGLRDRAHAAKARRGVLRGDRLSDQAGDCARAGRLGLQRRVFSRGVVLLDAGYGNRTRLAQRHQLPWS